MHCNTLDEWLTWLEQLHPNTIDLGLRRVHQVAARTDLLSPSFPIITVAGTNGKGSVCALLESVLVQAGYTVGLYTSPHIFHYNERVRINACVVSDALLCSAFEYIEQYRADTSLTYFEFGTLAAMWCFAQRAVDIAVLEVGLGGRLDAVNLWDANVSIISSLALDHTDWLGDTLEDIAFEKTGIARKGRALIVGESAPAQRLFECVDKIGAALLLRGRHYDYQLPVTPPSSPSSAGGSSWHFVGESVSYQDLPVPGIEGHARYLNAATAVQAIECIGLQCPVTVAQLHQGLRMANLPGRAQHARIDGVNCVFDVAHNPQAIAAFANYLSSHPCEGKTIAVAAFMADKAIAQMLNLLAGTFDRWYIGDLSLPRAMPAIQLAALLKQHTKADAHIATTLKAAFGQALAEADCKDRVVVFGSFVTVAETLPPAL